MLSKEEIEQKLNINISDEHYQEIQQLEYMPLTRVRNNPTGKIFNRLLVLGRAPSEKMSNGKSISKWWCLCQCGKIIDIRINNLTSGNTKSCGCLNLEKMTSRIVEAGKQTAVDLTNKKFGKLLALNPTDKRKNGSIVWKCQCDCGNVVYIPASYLNRTYNGTLSCGCLKESRGVLKIKEILNQNNIKYETEKIYLDCVLENGGNARFDFYLPKYNRLIEYDGEQHFKEGDLTFFKDTLEQRQKNDNYKNNYCKQHKIPLVRIPYWEINNLSLDMLLSDNYLI